MSSDSGLVEASPELIRRRIDSIPGGEYTAPHPSKKYPNGYVKVDGDTLRVTDMMLYVTGARISEVSAPAGSKRNISHTLTVEEDELDGEKVLLFRRTPLKKKSNPTLEIGVPLDPRYEPYAEKILAAWRSHGGNPCTITSNQAQIINPIVFEGLGYRINPRVVYKLDDEGKPLRDAAGKKTIDRIVQSHMARACNHVMRHVRARELRRFYKLTREERTSWFNWSTMNLGGSSVQDEYDQVEWIEYFHKLLKPRPSSREAEETR